MNQLARLTVVLVALVGVGLAPRDLRAHDFDERRRVILSVEEESLDILIYYELPPGALAAELRQAIDTDGNAIIDGSFEELARAQLLLPRVSTGLSITLDDVALEPSMVDVAFQEGLGPITRRGFLVMLWLRAPLPPEDQQILSVGRQMATPPIALEVQVVDSVTIDGVAREDPGEEQVVGPMELEEGEIFAFTLRRVN